MWPWPETATLGIQKPRGLVAAESNRVPDWSRAGVPVRLPISYQREPFRPPEEEATPEVFTWILWAVYNEVVPVILFLRMAAPKSRSSKASKPLLLPLLGCEMGKAVLGTVRLRLA